MKTIKISKATELQLDWLVATCEGYKNLRRNPHRSAKHLIMNLGGTIKALGELNYHESWSLTGPIIDRIDGFELKVWLESKPATKCEAHIHNYEGDWIEFGPTPLIAAMRCWVAKNLGETAEVPEELE